MKRRLLPMMMTLVLVCALPIWAAFVTSGDVTNPLVSIAGATEPDLQTEINNAPETGATITLKADTTIATTLEINWKTDLTLDLNGYVLRLAEGATGSVIKVGANVSLTIQDSQPNSSHEGTTLPAGGIITGGNADRGGGVFINGAGKLKMTGGCITGCHAANGCGIYVLGPLYMSGTARIKNCTAGEGWNANAIFNSGTIYADGGTVDGTINNQGTIKRSDDATDVTSFNGTVYNQSKGVIAAGTYTGAVENNNLGTITGGTFYGDVGENGGTIDDSAKVAVTFNADGGASVTEEKVLRGQKVSKPAAPTKSGHTFIDWYLGDAPYDFSTPVTRPLHLLAKWEEKPQTGGYYYTPPEEQPIEAPKTADPGVALYAALSLLSLTGLTCTTKKR